MAQPNVESPPPQPPPPAQPKARRQLVKQEINATDLHELARKVETAVVVEDLKRAFPGSQSRVSAPELFADPKARWAVLASALVLLALGAFAWVKLGGRAFTTVVPSVVGQPISAAKDAINRANLRPVMHFTPVKGKAPGTVLTLTPRPGSRVKIGSDVQVTAVPARDAARPAPRPTPDPHPTPVRTTETPTHANPTTAPPAVAYGKVPDVHKMTVDRAREELTKAGFKTDTPPGTVDTQIVETTLPAASTLQRLGSPVRLQVQPVTTQPPIAPRSNLITVRQYKSWTAAEAEADLRTLGLLPVRKKSQTYGQGKGTVYTSEPPAGAQLPRGSTVTLFIVE
jgi:beta-lactam-binding protein with PASTA domain